MANRLANESSPYLQQHQENPVDWYPWGEEAFAAARAADKPVFVSIGYAACHWCHVMAHESFEDDEIAALMNELFINVKVDREERPDVDSVYMNAIHVMGEGGGWPLSAFCDPEGRPYFLGTYYPPVDRWGRPGFPTVLRTMAKVYAEQRDKVEQNALAVLDGLRHLDEHHRRAARSASGTPGRELLVGAGRALVQRSDPHHGGFGSKPKFPSSSAHELLGRCGRLPFGTPARDAFLLQAQEMARGGIYDHLGGGFARYSVDERWLVPHFEKMLYDNAQLLGIYGDAFAMTGERDHVRVIEETVAWLSREMLDDSGGLYASQDADSEGEEGKFYVWTPDEIESVLGAVRTMLFSGAYGVTAHGNFEDGTTVLSRVTERGADSDEAALAAMRAELFAAREKRVRPGTDTKILAGWNGLAVSGLVRAWEATGHEPALSLARRVAEFLAERLLDGERLWRVYKDGERKLDGTVDDYAFVAHAFLRLAEATGEASWWQRGATLITAVLDRFYEEEDGVGVFYMTAKDTGEPLVHRPESHTDGAIPSGAAVAIECLVRLWRVGGDERARDVAERYLAGRAPQAAEQPFMAARLLCALDDLLHGSEVVIAGDQGRDALVSALRRAHAPGAALAGPWAHADVLAGKEPGDDGKARAYVCRGQTCAAPVSDPDALVELLAPAS